MDAVYVLDAGAFLSTWTEQHPDFHFVTSEKVVEEIRNRTSKQRIETLLTLERLKIEASSQQTMDHMKTIAQKSGDLSSLSEVDIDILSLAKELSLTYQVTLVSTDLAVLNVARYAQLEIIDPSAKMRDVVEWQWKCPACTSIITFQTRNNECPVCGTTMRRVRKRSRHI